MAKPICLIYYKDLSVFNGQSPSFKDVNDAFEKRFDDYHVLCIPTMRDDVEYFDLQIYNGDESVHLKFDELKSIVFEELNNLKQ